MTRAHERCEECGFDGARYTNEALLDGLRSLEDGWRQQLAAAGTDLRTRPDVGTWSAIEYASHSRDITALHVYGVEQALTGDEPSFPPIAEDMAEAAATAYGAADPDEVLQALAVAADRLARLADDAGVEAWTRGLTVGGTRSDVRRLLEHALHDSQHHLDDVERGLANLRAPIAEHAVDVQLVVGLLTDQHPDLVDLPLRHLSHGWDNESYRLGDDMVVRLPRRRAAAELIIHEQRWLGHLGHTVRLPIPVPLRVGRPGRGYPWSWSVVPWLPGDAWEASPPRDIERAAADLGTFLAELHRAAPPDAPRNPYRGIPLADRTERFDAGLAILGDRVEAARCGALFRSLAATPTWTAAPVWLHGDLHPLNMLVADGRLRAVIDWGDLCAGDPATDLAVAWMVLPAATHPTFRLAAGTHRAIDDATWARARGWALALSVAYLASADPAIAGIGTRTLLAALDTDMS